MKMITRMRRIVALFDNMTAQHTMDEQERQLTIILLDLGVAESNIKFKRDVNEWGIQSRFSLYSWADDPIDYDVLIMHPMVEIASTDTINMTTSIMETINGISIDTTIMAEATMPKEDQDTLMMIGKIGMTEPEMPRAHKVLLCNNF